jgi:hypothetical protein
MSWGDLWTALPLLAVLAASPARAATIWLTVPDGAEPCSFEQLAAAIRSRLPEVRVEAGVDDLDPGDVAVAMHRDVDGWSLVVRAAGEPELRRKLPPVGVDCVGLAQTAAVMVERYLGEVRWTGAQVVVAPLHPKPNPEDHWRMAVELGVVGAINPSTNSNAVGFNPALELDVGARKGPWELGLALSGEPPQLAAAPGNVQGVAEIQYTPATLELLWSYRLKVGPGAVRFELLPGVEAVWASLPIGVQNAPNSSVSTSQAVFTVGARVALEVPIYRRLFASLRLTGHVIVPDVFIFFAAGLPATPYDSGNETADASLALGYTFF